MGRVEAAAARHRRRRRGVTSVQPRATNPTARMAGAVRVLNKLAGASAALGVGAWAVNESLYNGEPLNA